MPFTIHQKDALVWLTAPILDGQAPRISHGFSTRQGGVSAAPFDTLNLGVGRGDEPESVRENYRRFCGVIGTDSGRTILSRQIHETTVRVCTTADAGKGLWFDRDYTADGLVTSEPNLPLVVFSADCGIILLYDPETSSIGAVHAGWRGCAAGIVEKTVETMHSAFGARPENILAAVGPCIGPCCFETDEDVPAAMRAALGSGAEALMRRSGEKYHVDLAGLNRLWLERAGVTAPHIQSSDLCTGCRPDLFWSHRKMGNARGAQIAMISMKG